MLKDFLDIGLFKENSERSEHVGDGQRRYARLGEEEGKKGHNSRI